MDDLIAEFLTESQEGLAELDTALVQLERNPGHAPTLALVFRIVHTIKGTCGFLGLSRLQRVAHAAEEVLGRVRDGTLQATPDLVGAVLAAIDRIKVILAAIASGGGEPPGEDADVTGGLGRFLTADPPADDAAEPPAPPPSEAEPARAAGAEPPEPAAAATTIRVAVDVLETLMTLVSELVLTRNQLLQLSRTKDSARAGASAADVAAFAAPLQRLSQITSDLQEGVMKTRMQPVGAAWNKLPRLARDLSHELGKKIDLVMAGAETELDRQVLELIRDPLTHMVRNSADHGLETPAERRAAGKPEAGRLSLTAFHEGGHVVIEVGDDGRGLDLARIRAKAAALDLATPAELEAMPEAQIARFIFHPGFSTAAKVTAVSGRGVGMDVVKTNIERIGGTIELKTTPGRGSTFTIRIPLTLAIVSALIVAASGHRFAIPQISVIELVRPRPARGAGPAGGDEGAAGGGADAAPAIEWLDQTPVLRLRERLVPLVSLDALMRLTPEAARPADEARHVVVAQVGGATFGIIVDEVFDTEEIVVKPMAPILRHVTLFGGNTILGDGSVIMILDPVGIARASGIGTQPGDGAAGAPAAAVAGGRYGSAEAGRVSVRSDDRIAMLLFRAGESLMGVPLGLVARLEDIPRERMEFPDSGDGAERAVTQYRGGLMPLVPLSGRIDRERASHPVLVFTTDPAGEEDGAGEPARERCAGLLVDEIVDVVDEALRVRLSAQRPGVLGTAIVAGRAASVLDTRHWLTKAHDAWFRGGRRDQARAARVLVVEDSSFFRQLLLPVLATAGYVATAAGSAAQALALREAGQMFEAIVSDVEMPDMDGLGFARAVRAGGPWAALPLIALSARIDPADVAAGRAAGFTDYIAKFEQELLLASLRQCLAQSSATSTGTDEPAGWAVAEMPA